MASDLIPQTNYDAVFNTIAVSHYMHIDWYILVRSLDVYFPSFELFANYCA